MKKVVRTRRTGVYGSYAPANDLKITFSLGWKLQDNIIIFSICSFYVTGSDIFLQSHIPWSLFQAIGMFTTKIFSISKNNCKIQKTKTKKMTKNFYMTKILVLEETRSAWRHETVTNDVSHTIHIAINLVRSNFQNCRLHFLY